MSRPLSLTHADGRALADDLEAAVVDVQARADAWKRYATEAINAELALILYRLACRHGLHATGTEALLIRALDQAEAEIATLRDAEPRDTAAKLHELIRAAGMAK